MRFRSGNLKTIDVQGSILEYCVSRTLIPRALLLAIMMAGLVDERFLFSCRYENALWRVVLVFFVFFQELDKCRNLSNIFLKAGKILSL